jgi:hypothetical protein
MIEGYPEIAKDVGAMRVTPHLIDWAGQRQAWSWTTPGRRSTGPEGW